ncbi:MAG TPA: efflux RND transporter periplasmic adaptor subunit [Bacteroidota bacterium]|nr:efflux RND transporter periplasmic adaptor subunit [Bacteroidota bacterium]
MNKRTKYLLLICAVIIVGLSAWKIAASSSASNARRQTVPIVKLEPARREDVVYALRFTGDAVPILQASIYSRVSGILDKVYVDMGAVVGENQMLALIDTTELSTQYMQNSATYQNAKINYEREQQLSEQNLVAKQDLDNADAAMKVAKENYEDAKIRLDYARITAPFSGIVTKRFLDPGSNVVASSSQLFNLMNLDLMKIIVNVLEKDIPLVNIGRTATVTVDAYPGKQFSGSVVRMSQAVDLSTRTMEVEIDVPNRDHLLKPGMFCTVALIIEQHRDAVTISTQCILKDEKGPYVFSVEGNTAHRHDLTLGVEQNARTEIIKGLSGNEQIVSIGEQFVRDSGTVNVQQ